MGVKITIENIDEYLTSFIDGQYQSEEERQQVQQFIEKDERIYKKYKSELLTRNLLKTKLTSAELPHATVVKINNSVGGLVYSALENKKRLAALSSDSEEAHFGLPFLVYVKRLLTSKVSLKWISVPAYSFAIVFMIIMILSGIYVNRTQNPELNPFITSGSDKSVMVQAVNTFHKILSGEIKTQLNSTDENAVCDYLKDGTKFDAYVPCLKNCNLKGAAYNEYNGQKLAHIVYTSGKEVIYIYETHISSINRRHLEVPDPVHNQMISDKYYMCDHVDKDNCTLMMWYKDSILCATVSTMSKRKLYNTIAALK